MQTTVGATAVEELVTVAEVTVEAVAEEATELDRVEVGVRKPDPERVALQKHRPSPTE
jgi:hypothetical protein